MVFKMPSSPDCSALLILWCHSFSHCWAGKVKPWTPVPLQSCISSTVRAVMCLVLHWVKRVLSECKLPFATSGFSWDSIPEIAICHLLRLWTLYRYLGEKRRQRGKAVPPSSTPLCLHLFFMLFKLVNHMTINRNTLSEERRGNCCLSGQVV